MDKNLKKARNVIDEVDRKMAELFIERMKAAEDVYEYNISGPLRVSSLKWMSLFGRIFEY